MGSPGRARKFFLGLGILLLLLILVVLALPLWFPWVLGPLANKYGLNYSSYERIGFERFRLNNVSFTNQTVSLNAGQLEGFLPLPWLLKQRRSEAHVETFLEIANWQLTLSESSPASTNKKPDSVYGIYENAEATFTSLREWLPRAVLTNGIVHAQKIALQVPTAIWTNGTLSTEMVESKHGQILTLKLSTTGRATDISLDSPSLRLHSALQLARRTNNLHLSGTNIWHGNTITLDSTFAREGMLPDTAHIEAGSFRVPPELLRLEDYHPLTGSFSADWESNRLALSLTSHAAPADTNNQNIPPVDLALQANGDTGSILIHRARITSPWLQFQLTDEARILFQSPYITNAVSLAITSDLSRQPWLNLSGALTGHGTLEPTFKKYPRLDFEVSGTDIAAPKLNLKRAQLRGYFDWPMLEISKGDFAFADGSSASLMAKLNAKQKSFDQGKLSFNGSFGRQWLPSGYSYENASAEVRFDGPFTNLSHNGTLAFHHLVLPRLKPLELAANWDGRSIQSLHAQASLSASNSLLVFEGTANTSDQHTNLTVKTLSLKTNQTTLLQLEKPFEITLQRDMSAASNSPPAFIVKPFRWVGQEKSIGFEGELNWPNRGMLSAAISKFDLSLFHDFVSLPAQKVVIDSLDMAAGWTNGPLNFDLNTTSTVIASNSLPFSLQTTASGNSNGISITRAFAVTDSNPIISANGSLPMLVWPGRPGSKIQFLEDKPLDFHAISRSNSVFWNQFASITGITLGNPRLKLDVSGSWQSPHGNIRMQAELIRLPEKRYKLPSLENLNVDVTLTRISAVVDQISLLVQGQPVSATGSVPLKENFWEQLIEKHKLPDWREASARLTIQNAQVSAFARLLPTILTPEGMINADLSIVPGGILEGFVNMEGVQTRPLATIGPLRDIKLNLQFTNRTARVNAVVGAGGQSVFAEGNADLRNESWLRGELPPFDVKVRGSRVPLARKPNLVLRGDLDITILKTNHAQPLVTGEVRLRDSFFLQNLRSLIPGRLSKPDQRPPYFSIETPPLSDWRLNLSVVGNRFMKIRDPLFVGETSANLKIMGIMKNPIALGDVRIDSGTVQFPFGYLEVTSGFVTLTSENPYRPQLNVTAGARQFGYDIKMEITGPADEPVIQFSSVPSLTSEQILVMLTAGELPRNDFSLTPQQRMQRLAMYLGKNLLFQYGFGDSSQRLIIRSGQDISQEGRATYVVEYRLNEALSVVGEYDRFGDFNVGLKWLIYSK